MNAAVEHCAAGLGIWAMASNDELVEPDVVMACCCDEPTLEILVAVMILREHFPELIIRVVDVVDQMRLQPDTVHPHGLSDHDNIHVDGYKEEGAITTPFDLTVLNEMDRFHLVITVIGRLPKTGEKGIYLKQQLKDKLIEHLLCINKYGEDMPEICDWRWKME